jgi:DNA modification methylase
MESNDYKTRSYLSAIEAAKFLGISVETLHDLTRRKIIPVTVAASGQMRFSRSDLIEYEKSQTRRHETKKISVDAINLISLNDTTQRVIVKNSQRMEDLADNSVHLMITSPPYFNAKMYSKEPVENDLGNVHDVDVWFQEIGKVWKEVFRVLQPGRKAFINIMNLPIRFEDGRFKSLNLAGKTIDLCEDIGFIFKRDIIWYKTHSVRAHFGTYPYPGGILINNMHEFILELEKPAPKGYKKYEHISREQKEQSKLDKEFWLLIKNSDVWVMGPKGSGDSRNHVAPFPYELPFRLIKAFSYIGETVLDPFLGSGTALMAAADLKRNGIGYEIVPELAAEAIESLKTYQAKLF